MKPKRVPWLPLGGTLAVALLVACTQQAPAAPTRKAAEKPAGTTPIPTVATPARSPAAAQLPAPPAPATKAAPPSPSPVSTTASPASATKAASPQAAKTDPRTEPKGKATYVWHIAIAPVYFDPQENPATVTQ